MTIRLWAVWALLAALLGVTAGAWAAPSARTTCDGPLRRPPFFGALSSSVNCLMRLLMSAWRCSVPLCFGMVRIISRRHSSRSRGSRALRKASSAFL